MSKENNPVLQAEKQKRKEVAKVRIFWFTLVLDIILIGYIAIQVIILAGGK